MILEFINNIWLRKHIYIWVLFGIYLSTRKSRLLQKKAVANLSQRGWGCARCLRGTPSLWGGGLQPTSSQRLWRRPGLSPSPSLLWKGGGDVTSIFDIPFFWRNAVHSHSHIVKCISDVAKKITIRFKMDYYWILVLMVFFSAMSGNVRVGVCSISLPLRWWIATHFPGCGGGLTFLLSKSRGRAGVCGPTSLLFFG
jgi:hypothetical protein